MRWLSLMVVALGLAMTTAWGEEETAPATEEKPAAPAASESKGVGLVKVGAVDDALIERARKFVEYQTAIPVHLHEAREPQGKTLNDEGLALAETVEPRDICLVAVIWPAEESKDHAVYLYDKRIGVINAQVLKPDMDDPELYGRRMEKLVMRSMGLLLDVQLVPNPQSVLFPYKDMSELDQIGRNYDPPTLVKLQAAAAQRGVTDWVKDSPYIHWIKK